MVSYSSKGKFKRKIPALTANKESLLELAEHVEESLSSAISGHKIMKGELILYAKREKILDVLLFLRDNNECQFRMLMDICGADYPARDERFDVIYHLLSPRQNARVMVKITADAETPVPTVTGIFGSANWYEREVFDMFGVLFSGHPDLRRILTDYGFEGHPLRKDFPLTGHVEMRYDLEQEQVVYAPVKLEQPYRQFGKKSNWKGVSTVLDKKEGAGS